MPHCMIYSSVAANDAQKDALLKDAEKALSDIIGKPVSYVMVSYVQSAHMRFGGSADPCAFIKVSSIGGLNASVNNKLAAALSAACNTHLGVKPSRVFSNFTNVPASEWGMGDRTFG